MEAFFVQTLCCEDDHVPYEKAPRLIDRAHQDPYGCMREIFIHFHLDDLCEEINEWMEVALINEESAYAEGLQRQDLMDFCHGLQRLAEGMHLINEKNKPADADKWMDALPEDLRARFKNQDQPVMLDEKAMKTPFLAIEEFCTLFSHAYVRCELWDMLDAAIGYEGDRSIRGINLLMAWESMSALTECAFALYEGRAGGPGMASDAAKGR